MTTHQPMLSHLPVVASLLIAGVVMVAFGQGAQAEPPVGRKVPASERVSINDIDHDSYNELLQKYVDADGYVDYTAWQASREDQRALQDYLSTLSTADLDKPASKEAKLAYWINAYNAITLEGILRVYPTDSIRNHTAKLWGYNIWKNLYLLVDDQQLSLDDIEHKILRKMDEPRIHFAIVCASVGCPRLLSEAYTAEKIDEQLTTNATDFFSRETNLKIEGTTLYLSSILSWFGEDFGGNQTTQLKTITPYLPENARRLAGKSNVRVRYLDYDWGLNDQKLKKE
ncbi:DUF547 domain-containing protein [Calycomorphotria hydatis]|uniref:DUF547 domain-containing protein n=1 Tax=Calycomorphotria hydatis TaxID=2528027 RepID=A0A517T4G9_9PLAN|nr:DUF547 domain-containing protein [Calycomorphotria hydatis]QDT63255.1 hypothetical protein V22_04740 [Calycomorphotria hydatis]